MTILRNYSSMVRWLLQLGETETLREIICNSRAARSKIPHPDPDEANARLHESECLLILFTKISYFLEQLKNGGEIHTHCVKNRDLMDAWIEMGCPGLVDKVVTEVLRRHNLFDSFMLASAPPYANNKN